MRLELKEKPDVISKITSGFFEYQAILFLLFDLSKPVTFKREGVKSSYENVDIEWLHNESN